MDVIPYEAGAYYVFDRDYVDYTRLYRITQLSAYFVIRAKSNLEFKRIYSNKIDKSAGVQCDQIGRLSGFYTSKGYPEKLRRIKFYDEETKHTFEFLTNNIKLTSNKIVLLYKTVGK